MTKFVKKHRSQFGRVSVVMLTIAGLVMMSSFVFLFVGTADAVQLSARSATLQDSEHSQLSQMTFVFTTGTALTTDAIAGADFSFVLNFPTEATTDPYGASVPNFVAGDVTATCTSCAGQVMAVTAVEESDNAGEAAVNDEFLVAINETGQDSIPLPIGSVVTLTLGAATGAQRLTNPADNPGASAQCTDGALASDADVCSITVGTSETITGAAPVIVDTGDVLVAHISDVTVSVTVDESLTFSINSVTNANCDTTFAALAGPDSTSNSIDFGTVSTFNTFIHACQDLAVVTNASNGYTVTTETDTSLQSSGGIEIDSGTCDGACDSATEAVWATNTNNGFGYSCSTLTNDDAGNACNLTTEVTNYKRFPCIGAAADCAPANSEPVHNVMTDTGTGDDSARLEYKLSISNTQAAAVYSTQVTYIATPTF